jgi:two-component system cell cycle sensor histidine kinase/response regulator CckA
MGMENVSASGGDLRGRAEALAGEVRGGADVTFDLRTMVHELRVHEIELSMQNEELRRSQDELAASRDAYRALYDGAPVGYLTLEPRGVIVASNATAASMLGVDDLALRSTPLSSLLSRADADRLYLHLRQATESRERCSCEVDVEPSPARSPREAVRLRLDSVAVDDGEGLRFHTTLTDVSERHDLEQQLRQLNDDLERRVNQRTLELRAAHERLLTAGKMEAIGRLAGGVAHDFNNLLTVIRLQTGMLRRQLAAGGPAAGGLADIERASRTAAALVGKLLAFARSAPAHAGGCDPVLVIRELSGLLRGSIPEGIGLALHLADDAGWVDVDRASLEQVVMNLVYNGRDAIADAGAIGIELQRVDGATVALRHPEADPSRDYVMIAVRDSGHGMDAETLGRAFEPFYTTKGGERGTGFGLATVYGVVMAAAGFIDLRSEKGRGTEVLVYLPRLEPAVSHGLDADDEWPVGSGTILVVDDDEQVRAATRSVAQRGGYTVIDAASGADALAHLAANRHTIRLVLTDIVMPGMSGIELAKAIAAVDASLPVVLMSGYFVELPMDATWRVLQKPFTPQELLQELRRTLDAAVPMYA